MRHYLSAEVALLGHAACRLYDLAASNGIGLVREGYPAMGEEAAWLALLQEHRLMHDMGIESMIDRVLGAEQQEQVAERLGTPELREQKVVEMAIKLANASLEFMQSGQARGHARESDAKRDAHACDSMVDGAMRG